MKETGGIEKGLLRAAVADLLPAGLVRRAKSIYPASTDPGYARAVSSQLELLLRQPGAPLFELVDRACSPPPSPPTRGCAAVMAVQPSAMAPAAFLLDVNEWLSAYQVRIVERRRCGWTRGPDGC